MEAVQAVRIKREIARRKAQEDILAFTGYTNRDYKINWHHRLLCDYLNRFINGEVRNLMVFMPPRHGKSELVSRRLPAFLFGRYPKTSIIASSYGSDLAGLMNRDVQRIMDSDEYKRVFPQVAITEHRNSEAFETTNGGYYKSAGIGGGITGLGANFAIIDDPIKNHEDANSQVKRDTVENWYTSTLYTRLQPPRSILITLTRWHDDDLAGRLLRKMKSDPNADQWTVLNIPARKVKENAHPQDPRKLGDPLWPQMYGDDALTSIESSVGPRMWVSLYQQSPTPASGGFFYDKHFVFGPMPPKFDYTFIMGDTAYKEKQENDYNCFTHFGVVGKRLYVTDVYRVKIKAADIEEPAKKFIKKHSKYGFRGAYIEPKGHGIYLTQKFRKDGFMMPSENQISEFFRDRKLEKVERASNAVPYLTDTHIVINEDIAEKEDLKNEMLAFPKGVNDDFVDTVVDGIKYTYDKDVSILDVL